MLPVGFISTVSYVTGRKDEVLGLSSMICGKSHTLNVSSHALDADAEFHPRVRVYSQVEGLTHGIAT